MSLNSVISWVRGTSTRVPTSRYSPVQARIGTHDDFELDIDTMVNPDDIDLEDIPLTSCTRRVQSLQTDDTPTISSRSSFNSARSHVTHTHTRHVTNLSTTDKHTRTRARRRRRRLATTRFLSDFTLGFADGLMVPFALTAGLSSLGKTDLVIYAGVAEIVAGCVSMGVGGFLAARPSSSSSSSSSPDEGEGEGHVPHPVAVGGSVALGYGLGGLLPLFPYLFVGQVGEGLAWSFGVCVLALWAFGFGKDLALRRMQSRGLRGLDVEMGMGEGMRMVLGVEWEDLGRSALEGLLVAGLGSAAALIAILCVKLVAP